MSSRKPVVKRKPRRKQVTGRGDYVQQKPIVVRSKPAPRIRGRGDYVANVDDSMGRQWGGYAGSKLGEWAGGALSKLFGYGDYSVRKNIFAMGGQLPEIVNNPTGGGTIIRYQEYLDDVITSATANTFSIQTYLINAGNLNTFPFLSQIALNYDQYEFEGMVFEFRSTSADALNSTNTALGSVMMATQYDSADPVFASKSEMLNYEFSTSCKPSVSNLHMIECDPHQTAQPLFYTFPDGAIPIGTDPRLYNLGNFSIATTGFQGTSVNVGELHVTYQVRLLKPKLYTSLGFASPYYTAYTGPAAAGAYTNASPFGTIPMVQFGTGQNDLQVVVNQNVPNQLIFPVSSAVLYYRVELFWGGTATSGALAYPTYAITNGTITNSQTSNIGVASSISGSSNLGVKTNGGPISTIITLGGTPNLPLGSNAFYCRVILVNPATLAD